MKRSMITMIGLALIISACTAPGASPSGSTGPLTEPELKFALLDRLGELWYCDPDEYPVSRGDEAQLSRERFPEIQADVDAFAAITARLGIAPNADVSDAQKLAIYRTWKQLNAIQLSAAGDDRFTFEILTRAANVPEGGLRTTGQIDRTGAIEIGQQAPSGEPTCPICLALGTLIATPDGPVPVQSLRVGDLVWTPDAGGGRRAVPIIRAGNTQAPDGHRVVAVQLGDGRRLTASPGHPLADGRLVGDLRVGDLVDGARVMATRRVDYTGGRTYDILPDGPTGAYWADGVLLGSTLAS